MTTRTILIASLILGMALWPSQSRALTFVRQWGAPGSGSGQFSEQQGLCTDRAGNVYVADCANNRIQKFDGAGQFLLQWGSAGSGPGQFNYPRGVTEGPDGTIYVADSGNNRVQLFTPGGQFTGAWGTPGSQLGQLNSPSAVVVDETGNVFVSDMGNNRVDEFGPGGTYIRFFGTLPPTTQTGPASFNAPWGLSLDGGGLLYVADLWDNRVAVFDTGGAYVRSIQPLSGTPINGASCVALSDHGTVYVCDYWNRRILEMGLTGAVVQEWGDIPTISAYDQCASSTPGILCSPKCVAVDSHGNVFVSDRGNGYKALIVEYGLSPTPAVRTTWGQLKSRYR